MKHLSKGSILTVMCAATTLAGCGGSDGSGMTAELPPPPNRAVEWAEPLSLETSQDLVVLTPDLDDGAITMTYDAERGLYYMTMPGAEGGMMITRRYDGVVETQLADVGTRAIVPFTSVSIADKAFDTTARYSFTGSAQDGTINTPYLAVVPTSASDVPVTGSASFAVQGHGDWIEVSGAMDFDFASGTLEGFFDALATEDWGDDPALGRYQFADTVFGVGSTTFSGGLVNDRDPTMTGSFAGLFAGPGAAEVAGQFSFAYHYSYAPETIYNASGLFAGVR